MAPQHSLQYDDTNVNFGHNHATGRTIIRGLRLWKAFVDCCLCLTLYKALV